jgi:hypothetical protein
MAVDLAFPLGLLASGTPPYAAAEDFVGPGGIVLHEWQRLGFLATVPERHPVPSCPHCYRGEPYGIADRYLCGHCGSRVTEEHLWRWRFDVAALLGWLSRRWRLNGQVQSVDKGLWQLGSFWSSNCPYECFFSSDGSRSDVGGKRLQAYRNGVLLHSLPTVASIPDFTGPCFALLELLWQDEGGLHVRDLAEWITGRGAIRFDLHNGTLRTGDQVLGEVPVGSKEFYFLACLAAHLDQYVSYADLKWYVQKHTDSTDTTEEASFCHKLKRRLKEKGFAGIDDLVMTTNKADGYRLKGTTKR